MDHKLADIRAHIDALDVKLCALFNERAGLAARAAAIKQAAGRQAAQFYRPEREARILRRIMELNEGPLTSRQITAIYREIISACMAQEQQFNIAYLGPEGTFTQAAALKHFGHSVSTSAFADIGQVFREVEGQRCTFGVAPVENSIEGAVNHTLDMLIDANLKICGEVKLRIRQQLLSNHEEISAIEVIYSHEQSLAQCRQWLDEHLPAAQRRPVSSNAEAALCASREGHSAAIAGENAAVLYGLPVLRANIEDDPNNTTRFLVIGKEAVPASGDDKTSILFAIKSKPGSLVDVLSCFAAHDVNMIRIESRPSRHTMWEYVFFVDLIGHVDDENVANALSELQDNAAMMKLLGSYPVAII